jgi:predicted metal-dependent hydrolase
VTTLHDPSAAPRASATTREVEVRRSARRRRTVSAYRDGARVVVLIPSRFSPAEEAHWVAQMLERLDANARRRRRGGDLALARRAAELSTTYLGGRARPSSVRWVPGMRTRWASCTPADGTIRVSDRLRDMPHWVRDYILVHELTHLLIPGHGPDFWAIVQRYPRTERARGYLDGVSAAAQLDLADDLADDLTDDLADDLADDLSDDLADDLADDIDPDLAGDGEPDEREADSA